VSFTLLPAVDVANGQAVSLFRAQAGTETSFGSPVEVARSWQRAGARWVHLVDVDAALGRGSNAALLNDMIDALDLEVELSGGIRDHASLAAALATGCARANLSTAALDDFAWCTRAVGQHGERIAVELDVRVTAGQYRLRARGHTGDSGDLWQTVDRLNSIGCARYIVTDVTRDGTMSGPNLDLLRQVCAATDVPVVASGGVATLDDLRAIAALAPQGVEAVIVGKALHSGRFTLPQALASVTWKGVASERSADPG
jgi:phosphoribosylanthranilate isomerase